MTKTTVDNVAGMIVDFLKSNGQIELLPDIITLLNKHAVKEGVKDSAIVTTAAPLSAEDRKAISTFIAGKYGAGYALVERIDPAVIAGFTIRVGDQVIDTTVASKLENMRKELV